MMHLEPKLKQELKEVDKWIKSPISAESLERNLQILTGLISSTGIVEFSFKSPLDIVGHHYSISACNALAGDDLQLLSDFMHWAVGFRTLSFRCDAMRPPDGTRRVIAPSLKTGMRIMGSAMLSDWATLEVTAPLYIAYAEAQQQHSTLPSERAKTWGKGTIDAFNIALLSQALSIPTVYAPVNPLIPELDGLLQHWRSTDETAFRAAMQPAAAYHLNRSKNNTKHVQYEFSTFFDWFFPAELLAVQALRARDGLPAFATGTLLVDTPWALIQRLPPPRPHPLLAAAEARLKADFPDFR